MTNSSTLSFEIPYPPTPATRISKVSAAARIGPGRDATVPEGILFQEVAILAESVTVLSRIKSYLRGPDVHPKCLLRLWILRKNTFLPHSLSTSATLLGWLEHEADCSVDTFLHFLEQ